MSFTLASGHQLLPPGEDQLGHASNGVSPGGASSNGALSTSPRPTGSGLGLRLNLHSAGERSRRSLDLDFRSPAECGTGSGPGSGPGTEASYYRNNRILHPWDMVGSVTGGPSGTGQDPGRTSFATAAVGLVVTNGAPAAAPVTNSANTNTQRPAVVPKVVLQSLIGPNTAAAVTAAAAAVQVAGGSSSSSDDQGQHQQQQGEGRAFDGSGSEGPAFFAHSPEPSSLVAPPRRSFEREPPRHASLDLPVRAASRMSQASSRNGGALWAEQPWVARAEGPTGQQTPTAAAAVATAVPAEWLTPPSAGADAPATASAAAAALGRPSTGAAAASGRIPQPSSLYGSSPSTLLGKLPPTRGSPRRGGGASTPGGSSNGSFAASAMQLQLAPHTQAAAAAAALALATGPADNDFQQAGLAVSAPPSPAGVTGAAAVSVSPTAGAGPGAVVAEGTAVAAVAGPGVAALAGSPQAASLLEAQRGGQPPNIEQILLGSGAAPSMRGLVTSPRPDPAALQAVQQAFRALLPSSGPGGKMPKMPATREDVWELQAVLLRQVSQLAAAPPSPSPSPSPSPAPPSASTAVVGAGLRKAGGRHISAVIATATATASGPATAACRSSVVSPIPGLTSESSRRAVTPSDMSPRRTTTDGSARSAPSEASLATGGIAAAATATAAGATSPGQVAVVAVGPPASGAPFSPEDVAFQPLLGRDADGFVAEGLITSQEGALTTALNGLVVQVGVSCVERAHLLHCLWATLRQLLAAVMQDREEARSQLATLRCESAAAASRASLEADSLRQQLASLTGAVAKLNGSVEKLNARDQEQTAQLAAAQKEIQRLRQAINDGEVESLGARLLEAQDGREAAREELARLQAQVKDLSSELYDVRQDQAVAASRAAAFESQAVALAGEVRSRTPRPSRSLGLLDELLATAAAELQQQQQQQGPAGSHAGGQQQLQQHRAAVLAALTAGAAPLELHRLMLGLNGEGDDMSPWAHAFAAVIGVVPPWSDAATHAAAIAPPPDAAAGPAGALLAAVAAASSGGGGSGLTPRAPRTTVFSPLPTPASGGGGGGGAGGGGQGRTRGVSFIQRGGVGGGSSRSSGTGGVLDAGGLPPSAEPSATDAGLASGGQTEGGGSGSPVRAAAAFGGGGGVVRRQTMAAPQQQAYMRRMHTWLVSLIEEGDVGAVQRQLPEVAVEAIGSGLHLGISPSALAAWLLGSLSPGGFNFAPFKELVGLLSREFQHTTHDLGGPVTSALELAALSTVQRIRVLENKGQELHREVVRLKRSLADHKRAERARTQAEEDAKERKNQSERTLHPVHEFISAKWSDFFMGLGTGPHVPKVLRAEGKVFNRRMEKVEAEKMVNAVWVAKDEWQARNRGSRITLGDFLAAYLQRKYTNPRSVTETAYNLVYTLGQHAYDPDCNLFVRVLLGEVDEGIRADEEELREDLVNMLSCVDRAAHGRATGYLTKRDMATALRGFFPTKTEARLEEVLEALDTDVPDRELVPYRRLFDDDGDLNQGVFAETIRTHHMTERLELLQSIEDALQEAADKARMVHVPPSLLASVLKTTLPDCTEESVRQYLCIVYGSETGIRAAEAAAPAANAAAAGAAAAAAKASAQAAAPSLALPGARASIFQSMAPLPPMSPRQQHAAVEAPGSPRGGSTPRGGGSGSGGSEGQAGNEASVQQSSAPTVEGVMALIRRGWVPHIPSIAAAVESLSIGSALKAKLQLSFGGKSSKGPRDGLAAASGGFESSGSRSSSSRGPDSPRRSRWAAALGFARGAAAAANGARSGFSFRRGRRGAASAPSWSQAQRAAHKRLRYLHVMNAVRETWLQEEQARVRQVVQLAHAGGATATVTNAAPSVGRCVGAGAGAARRDSVATLRAGAAAAEVKISSLASLPTAVDFASEEEPEVAALEAAQRILASQLAAANTAAGGGGGAGSAAGTRMHFSFIAPAAGSGSGGAEQMTPRLSRSPAALAAAVASTAAGAGFSAAGAGAGGLTASSGPTAAAVVLAEGCERLQRLRALGGIIAALVEDRLDAPSAGLGPELRRALYRETDPADSGGGSGSASTTASGEDLGAVGE